MMDIVFPEYNNSILSVTASVLHAYGAPCSHPGLSYLDALMAKPYKNKILLILDGMGSCLLDKLLPAESFLWSHKQFDLSSVYPCTTTAATTSMLSGLAPIEHGWLGWNAWFREFGRVIDLFLDRDSYSGLSITPSAAQLMLPFADLADLIGRAAPDKVHCHKVLPPFEATGVNNMAQMMGRIKGHCLEDGNQLILAYWHEPDTLMHNEGPYSEAVRQELLAYDQLLAQFSADMADTLLIITADHGQVEVKREIYLDEIPELHECLILPPSLECRSVSFFVKPHRKDYFAAAFNERFGDCYLLLTREEVFDRGLLGSGTPHPKVDDFIGDYLACATGQTIIRYHSLFNRPRSSFKGHHAGLCAEEMIVPLIIAST